MLWVTAFGELIFGGAYFRNYTVCFGLQVDRPITGWKGRLLSAWLRYFGLSDHSFSGLEVRLNYENELNYNVI